MKNNLRQEHSKVIVDVDRVTKLVQAAIDGVISACDEYQTVFADSLPVVQRRLQALELFTGDVADEVQSSLNLQNFQDVADVKRFPPVHKFEKVVMI